MKTCELCGCKTVFLYPLNEFVDVCETCLENNEERDLFEEIDNLPLNERE